MEEELKEIKSWKSEGPEDQKLIEIIKHLALGKKLDKAIEPPNLSAIKKTEKNGHTHS